jgi:hypothetical protein
LNNVTFAAEYGIFSASENSNPNSTVYVLGNLFYNLRSGRQWMTNDEDNPLYGVSVWGYRIGILLTEEVASSTRYVIGNTIVDAMGGFHKSRTGSTTHFINNIVADVDEAQVTVAAEGIDNVNLSYNLYDPTAEINWGGTMESPRYTIAQMQATFGQCTQDLEGEPLFVSTTNHDFHHGAASSAVDSALSTGLVDTVFDQFVTDYGIDIRKDLDLTSRIGLTWDRGAFENDTSQPPSAPTITYPEDEAEDVETSITLTWSMVLNAEYYEVYLDTVNPPVTQLTPDPTSPSIASGELLEGTPYYLKVIAVNSIGQAASEVTTFTTEIPVSLPGQVTNPSPVDDATSLGIYVTLTWDGVEGATKYNVYFKDGSVPGEGDLVSENQVGLSYATGVLQHETEYFWRIDSGNDAGFTTGNVWSFTTGAQGKYLLGIKAP